MSKIDLIQGDCLEKMKDIPSGSVDCIITDPPYRITARGATGTMGGYWKESKSKKGIIFDHNELSCGDYYPYLYRILKDKSLCYIMCNNINLVEMITEGQKAGFNFVKCLIWEKNNKICGRYYMGCFEYIILFRKGGDRPINNCGTPDILKVPIKKCKGADGKNLHDTEKPVELMKILIENSTNENDTVIDFTMGIGSTGVACVNTNRNFIGIELDGGYFEIAQKRICQAEQEKQSELF